MGGKHTPHWRVFRGSFSSECQANLLPTTPRTQHPHPMTCRGSRHCEKDLCHMVRMGTWPGPTHSRYLPTTLHSLMDLLQEVSLPAALGVPDGRGVRGLCDEQVGAAFVNPGGSRIEVGGAARLGAANWTPAPYIAMASCTGPAAKCHGQHLRDKRLPHWGGHMGDTDMLTTCSGPQHTLEGPCTPGGP